MTANAFRESCYAVREARSMCDRRNTNRMSEFGIGECHQDCAAFKGYGHESSLTRSHIIIDHKQVGIAHKAEHCIDTVFDNTFGD